jgi:hypothetical protein
VRALAVLLLLVAVVFAASFGLARATGDDPDAPSPPPAVVVPAVRLVEPGPPAQIPELRAQPRPAASVEE